MLTLLIEKICNKVNELETDYDPSYSIFKLPCHKHQRFRIHTVVFESLY